MNMDRYDAPAVYYNNLEVFFFATQLSKKYSHQKESSCGHTCSELLLLLLMAWQKLDPGKREDGHTCHAHTHTHEGARVNAWPLSGEGKNVDGRGPHEISGPGLHATSGSLKDLFFATFLLGFL